MKKYLFAIMALVVTLVCTQVLFGQDAAAPAEAPQPGTEAPAEETSSSGFMQVLFGSGWFGFVLWLGLFGCSIAGLALVVDCYINIQEKKIIPEALVNSVREAMEQGDLMKALSQCESYPSPLANVLSAGLTNVDQGFEVVQEAVTVASEMEGEKLIQRINYMNVDANIAPMLGLLGTVQGMILAFATLSTGAGAAKQAMLAMNISQALYTTAAGLAVAIPALGFFSFFKNRAMKIILSIESLTMDLLKVLRHAEVVES